MKRTWLRRSNPDRRAKMFARNYGDRVEVIHRMPCLVWMKRRNGVPLKPGQRPCCGDTQAAHVRARGAGGVKGDKHDLVNLCHAHHEEAGEYRTSKRAEFEALYEIDLIAEARALDAQFQGPEFDYGPPA